MAGPQEGCGSYPLPDPSSGSAPAASPRVSAQAAQPLASCKRQTSPKELLEVAARKEMPK